MIELYSPKDPSELSIIKSVLNAEGINYYVRNDNFGSLWVGPIIDLYNKKMIVVQDDQHELAEELLKDFLDKTNDPEETPAAKYSAFDKIRMALEALLFSWMIPGKRKNKKIEP